MALELKQSLKLSQQLVMTPQLQQAIKLLQLNRLELAQHCMNELLENPLLEEFSDMSEESTANDEETPKEDTVVKEVLPATQQGTDDINWENYLNSQSSRPVEKGFRNVNPDLPSFESTHSRADTLTDHLLWQAKLSNLDSDKFNIAEEIIGNLDENGYLMVPIEEIAKKLQYGTHEIEEVLAKIQLFDPVGVGCRDIKECLMIQTRHLKEDDLVRKMISEHLSDLEKKNYKGIAKRQSTTVEKVLEAVHVIQRLDPKPGRQFFDESLQYITPDIYVYYVNGDYVIAQNEDGLPKLKIAGYYQSILQGGKANTVAKEYINDKMRAALWLIRSIHQRQRTIYKVTESIVRIQKEFLEKGVSYLKPMVLKDVAEDIGMHESTVSRVTSNKYVHTPQGIFELKFFFNSSIKRVHGADVASEAVKERIRMIISSEDRKRPYSDQELVELLRQSNIDIARRTVAKYREMLGILSSSRRKDIYT
jgi:RNA polymerase sigma-54 factor